jgi:hypothetical protein
MENTQKGSVNEVDFLELLGKIWSWIEQVVQKIFVFFVGYVPMITCREDVTCSEYVTSDVTYARMRQYVA